MKVIYQNDTKKFADFEQYLDLVGQAIKAFEISDINQLGENLKFYYMDQEGDVISITNQGDLDEARCEPTLKLVISRNVEDAKLGLLGGNLNRSESILNQSMNSINYAGNGQLGGIGQAVHAELQRQLAA